MKRSPLPVAYHEAGHAVAIWFKTRKAPARATIVPSKDYEGQVTDKHTLKGIRLDIDNSIRARDRAEAAIISFLAGIIAQRRAFPRSVRNWMHGPDYEAAADLALRVCGSGKSASAYLQWLQIVAKEIVDSNWGAIDRVAQALVERSTLEAQEMQALILKPEYAAAMARLNARYDELIEPEPLNGGKR